MTTLTDQTKMHELDKIAGPARFPWCTEHEYWALPGGKHTNNPSVAKRAAQKIMRIMAGGV